jgi:uncharacterized protein (TIGR01777 family)
MSEVHFSFSTEFPFSADEVFAWHLRKGAVERMIPPWRRIAFLFPPGSPENEGSQVGLKVAFGPLCFRWMLEHKNLTHFAFSDVQISGPFKSYSHRHRVIPHGAGSCVLSEEIRYDPYSACAGAYLNREFTQMFRWRHAILSEDLKLFARHPRAPLRILLSGSRGLIGSHLKILLQTAGHRVVSLVRGSGQSSEATVFWEPARGTLVKEDFEGFDAVIHLAGESIAGGLWTSKRKEEIFLSRCRDTCLLSQALSQLSRPPKTLISASAVGFYGNRWDEELNENSSKGTGFLSDVCQKWELATEAMENQGCRVVHPRFAMVLSRRGGALKKMLAPFKWGLGGRIGSGEQIISWVGLDDAIGALYHLAMDDSLSGPVNIAAPAPVSQEQFAHALSRKLHRPACMPLPAGILRFLFREMADEVLLSSTRAVPLKLTQAGYVFRYPDLDTALNYV